MTEAKHRGIEEARNLLDALQAFVDAWDNSSLAGILATELNCQQAETLCALLVEAGNPDAASKWIKSHVTTDDDPQKAHAHPHSREGALLQELAEELHGDALTECVIDLACERASEASNNGVAARVKYLVQQVGEREALELVRAEAGK